MTSIPMPEFSHDWQAAMLKVRQGETVVLTENGKPVAQLSPAMETESPGEAKPSRQNGLLWMCELGEKLIPPGPIESLTNEEMDRIIYDH
jgi:prevent-host-death family protein